MSTFYRATQVEDFTGRTLTGIAYNYDKPSRVTDDAWQTNYLEEIVTGADVKTLAERASFPLFRFHRAADGPYGEVSFHHSDNERALLFEATVDKSADGDSLLEDANSGDWSDVSIGADFLRNAYRSIRGGAERVTQRIELRLNELSLAPTGLGLYKGAELVAVRAAEPTPVDRHEAVRRWLLLNA